MGSYKDNNWNETVTVGDLKIPYQGIVVDVYEQYLSRKVAENDAVSYWLMHDLYQQYLSAWMRTRIEIV